MSTDRCYDCDAWTRNVPGRDNVPTAIWRNRNRMARAVPKLEPQISGLNGMAVHGTRRNTTRHYLRSQLRQLDAQIAALVYAQNGESWRILERAMWFQPAAAKLVWTGRLELHYLETMRETLVESLMHL